ncbi:MAG: carboxypeptidase-like regulatory domain-containing protein [Bacteroidales bacterium]|nr:carboxypeptidase-like regulatory domain-containing protein [Bacteroidales bacterium]
MNVLRIIYSISLATLCVSNAAAQPSIAVGRVTAENGESIPYAAIKVLNKPVGTLTDYDGFFTFPLDRSLHNDTLSFSSLGYEDFLVPIRNIGNDSLNIILTEKTYSLQEVVVIPQKTIVKTFGRTAMSGPVEIGIASGKQEGCGVGVRINVPKRAWITSVSMGWIQRDNCVTRMPFRLNVYEKIGSDWVIENRPPVIFIYSETELNENGRFEYTLPDPVMIEGDKMIEFEFLEPMGDKSISIKSNIMAGHTYFHSREGWESIPMGGSFAVTATVEK